MAQADYYLQVGSHVGGFSLPLYLDRHELNGVSAADVAAAHELDLSVQDKHHVRYLSYWFDYPRQQAFCLVDAPNPDAAERVHRESHGLIPLDIIEVQQDQVEEFLGAPPHFPPGKAYESSAFRTILFTDIVDSTALTQRLGDSAAMSVLLVSQAVRELCAGKALEFDAARDLELRGFAEIVRAYATLPRSGAARRFDT